MTYARKSLVCLQDTSYYHCVARCVRRAWLWGFDQYAGRDYSHRKAWVLERLAQLNSIFAIDICAYAIMSNHYHVILHVDRAQAHRWTQQEVVDRWSSLFKLPASVHQWQQGMADEAESQVAEALIERWRQRLHDISWFMRALNEHLARRANAEDDCKGRFWEGRFKSQALLGEAGLLTAMVYVDLNPVRAGIVATPEASQFTSIYQRVAELRSRKDRAHATSIDTAARVPLLEFHHSNSERATIPYPLDDYLELVNWTSKRVRFDKSGLVNDRTPPIMLRLNINARAWTVAMRPAGNIFGRAIGGLGQLRLHAKTLGQSWVRGLNEAQRLYAG